MTTMTTFYMIVDMQGDGTALDPRRISDWMAPRWDVLCRVIRANLACVLADGAPNPAKFVPAFMIQADCSPAFGVAKADFPDDWNDDLILNSFHPQEPRPDIMEMMRVPDLATLKAGCEEGSQQGIAMVNAAGLGFTIGTTDPVGDIVGAMQAMTFTVSPTISAALRDGYVQRIQGVPGGEPPILLDAEGRWDTASMSDYATALDAAPAIDPSNAIHILYELVGAITLANSAAF